MIRNLENQDLAKVMELWFQGNIQAHPFIDPSYWHNHYPMVQKAISFTEVYIYEDRKEIEGFVGVDKGYIAGLFVAKEKRSQGIGKALLLTCKIKYPVLDLHVYRKNVKAVTFYLREGFIIEQELTNKDTGEAEYRMIWKA